MKKFIWTILAFSLLFLTLPSYGSDIVSGKCLRVIDGDTIEVEYNNKRDKVRLIGVDTPETKDPRKPVQYFGKEATEFTKKAVEGKNVRLEFDQTLRDKYDRLLAYVYLPNGEMLNAKIIKEGYGHAYIKYPFKYLEEFRNYEKQAREKGLGLWGKRDVKENPKKARAPNETTYKEETSSEPSTGQEQEETVYVTRTGKKYHREYCSYLRRSKIPISKKQAISSGYTPCSRCNP
jgi:micrococcal nuclease